MATLRRFLPKLGIGLVLACGVVLFGPPAFGIVYLGAWSLATGQLPTVSLGDERASREAADQPPPPVELPGIPLPPEPGAERIWTVDSGECEGFSSVTLRLMPERFEREPVIVVDHFPERGDCWARSMFRRYGDPPDGAVCEVTVEPVVHAGGELSVRRSTSPGCRGWIAFGGHISPAGGGLPRPGP